MTNEKVFTIRLPAETYAELKEQAEARHVNVVDIIRMFIRLGLLVTAENGPKFVFKDGEEMRPVLLV